MTSTGSLIYNLFSDSSKILNKYNIHNMIVEINKYAKRMDLNDFACNNIFIIFFCNEHFFIFSTAILFLCIVILYKKKQASKIIIIITKVFLNK